MNTTTGLLFAIALPLTLLYIWAFRHLPDERWQILAAVPLRKDPAGNWQGVNLTSYGFLLASGGAFGVALYLLLLGSINVSLPAILLSLLCIFGSAVPAASLIAHLVEGKKHTLTIGGASFTGLLAAPLYPALQPFLPQVAGVPVQVVPLMAALMVAYIFGESIGRLACISFGCCYGRPVAELGPVSRTFFSRLPFIFTGHTKKIAYASNLSGVKVVPIQAVTAIIYGLCGLIALAIYLQGAYTAAFLFALITSQGWRTLSETMRADYRGPGRLSAYQLMSLAAIPYGLAITFLWPTPPPKLPELAAGFATLFSLPAFLTVQGVWLLLFIYTGRSMVTTASLVFDVNRQRI